MKTVHVISLSGGLNCSQAPSPHVLVLHGRYGGRGHLLATLVVIRMHALSLSKKQDVGAALLGGLQHARTVPGTNRPPTKDAGFFYREIPPDFPFKRKPGVSESPLLWLHPKPETPNSGELLLGGLHISTHPPKP